MEVVTVKARAGSATLSMAMREPGLSSPLWRQGTERKELSNVPSLSLKKKMVPVSPHHYCWGPRASRRIQASTNLPFQREDDSRSHP